MCAVLEEKKENLVQWDKKEILVNKNNFKDHTIQNLFLRI